MPVTAHWYPKPSTQQTIATVLKMVAAARVLLETPTYQSCDSSDGIQKER